jgi:hypothetical protein
MRQVIVNVSAEYLRELLQLPADAEIVAAQMRFDQRVVQLQLDGVGDDVAPGMVIPQVTGKVTMREGEPPRIFWPFGSSTWPFPDVEARTAGLHFVIDARAADRATVERLEALIAATGRQITSRGL